MENKSNLGIPVAIVIAGALIALAVFSGGKPSDAPKQAANPGAPETKIAPITADDHIVGSLKAPIIIVEYSDTECPFCKRYHTTLKQIVETYGGKVAWVYRHFPLGLFSKSQKEAEATECAAELGGNKAFWTYIDRLYEITPSGDGLDMAELPNIAEFAGLNRGAFMACLNSGRHAAKVEAHSSDAIQAGGRGTPFSVIVTKDENIPITQGALPFEQLKEIIDGLL